MTTTSKTTAYAIVQTIVEDEELDAYVSETGTVCVDGPDELTYEFDYDERGTWVAATVPPLTAADSADPHEVALDMLGAIVGLVVTREEA